SPMSMTSALNAFLMVRSNGSNVERIYRDWRPGGVAPFDVMADWLKIFAETSVFLAAYFRRKYLNKDMIDPVAGADFVTAFVDAAAGSGLWGREHRGAASFAVGHMLSAITEVGIDANEQALSTWWNRWLDTYDAAMAIGHRVLRSPEGDPRTLGLLEELDEEF